MKSQNYNLVRYDADEGKVFDWAEARYKDVLINPENPEEGTRQEQDHLYAKTLFIGHLDSIDNYVEVDAPVEEEN